MYVHKVTMCLHGNTLHARAAVMLLDQEFTAPVSDIFTCYPHLRRGTYKNTII